MRAILANRGFISVYGLLLLQCILAINAIYYVQLSTIKQATYTYEDIFILHTINEDLKMRQKDHHKEDEGNINKQRESEHTQQEEEEQNQKETFIMNYHKKRYSFTYYDDHYEVPLPDHGIKMMVYFDNDQIINYEFQEQ